MSKLTGRIICAHLWKGEWDFELAFEKEPNLRLVFRNAKQRTIGKRVEIQFSGNHPHKAEEVYIHFLNGEKERDELTLPLGTITYFYKKTPSQA